MLPSFGFHINAQTNQTDNKAWTIPAGSNKTKNLVGQDNFDDKKIFTLSDPFISPNPVGPAGRVSITSNYSEGMTGINSIRLDIQGPHLGSTNPKLAPTTIGSLPMLLKSTTAPNGIWTTNFSFPKSLPEGNYLFSLTITDKMGNVTRTGPYSSIILDRNVPDPAETMIVSAVDGTGKSLLNGEITYSPDITFTFQGNDKTGVIQLFECNLDNVIPPTEHRHVEEQMPSAYSVCFMPTKIDARITGNFTYANLAAGNHTFKVRALDNEYNQDASPSVFSWTILHPQSPANGTLLGDRIS